MAGVAVVTDSTSSLPTALADQAGIAMISLNVVIDGISRLETDVDPGLVAAALGAGKQVTTTRPSRQAFAQTHRDLAASGYSAVVSVHLSAKMSGTYGAPSLPQKQLNANLPAGGKVVVCKLSAVLASPRRTWDPWGRGLAPTRALCTALNGA